MVWVVRWSGRVGAASAATFAMLALASVGSGATSAAPANDAFASAVVLSGASGTTGGTNVDATKQAGEPAHAGSAGGKSVWYRWTAPAAGTVTIDTLGSGFDTLLAVYTGSAVNSLTQVAANDDTGGSFQSRVTFTATAGGVYRIAVDGYRSNSGAVAQGTITLAWAGPSSPPPPPPPPPPGAPANDAFGSAQLLSTASGSVGGTNVGATKEPGEPAHAGSAGGKSVWYRWTAPAAGTVTIDTLGSGFDTLLAVYTGSAVNALTQVAANDDTGGSHQSRVTFTATAGRVYRIAVDGYRSNSGAVAQGTITLTWAGPGSPPPPPPGPANDAFASAVVLSGASGTTSGTNAGATKEAGEPAHAGSAGGKSVWYRWTAPATGTVTIDTLGSGFDTLLAVYTGSAVNALTQIAANDDTGGSHQSRVTFTATAGGVYRIAVDGYRSNNGAVAQGTITLTWTGPSGPPPGPPPANDAYSAAQSISGAAGTVNGTNAGATAESGEPAHAGQPARASVWYRWTAPSGRTVLFDTIGSAIETVLGVYRGSTLQTAVLVVEDRNSAGSASRVSFRPTSGTTYWIAVDSRGTATGPISLTWTTLVDAPPPAPGSDPVVAAAGDISSCAWNADEATAAVLGTIAGTVAALGDLGYGDSSTAGFNNCYHPGWGVAKGRTRPAVGNHEYEDPGAGAYFTYFGAAAGQAGQGWYSYDLGTWHVVVLNSNCSEVDCSATSAQVQWLRNDLAASSASCTLAYWHHPLFTSGPAGSTTGVRPFWDELHQAGADVILNGHEHFYERFAPMNPSGAADNAFGLRQFIVGTGGAALVPFVATQPNSQVRKTGIWGVLKLTLSPGSFSWQFAPIRGQTFAESGSGTCHGRP